MRRSYLAASAVAVAAAILWSVLPAGVAAARAVPATSGGWGTAVEVPGTASLNVGGLAIVTAVSCAAPGSCTAGGDYFDSSGDRQVFVASQVKGTWGAAVEVPGPANLPAGGNADVESVSCAAAGSCAIAGDYQYGASHEQVFVVSQVNGTWDKAIEAPGTAKLNAGGYAAFDAVSCGAPGSCVAGGWYRDRFYDAQAFVVSQVKGKWTSAVQVPGTAKLNAGGGAKVDAVSCAVAGRCTAGGSYADHSGRYQAFVVSRVSGKWGKAVEVPGTAKLNAGGDADVGSVSCTAPGSCTAGGIYAGRSGRDQAFVVSQVRGKWGRAVEVPGTGKLNAGGDAEVDSVSCAAPGSCTAGGSYAGRSGRDQAFVVSQVRGKWSRAVEVPGTGKLNGGGHAEVDSVSCASAGGCTARGFYTDHAGHLQAFVASQVKEKWDTALEVPGTAELNAGGQAGVNSVSCAAPGSCTAGGFYTDGSGNGQAFVATKP